MKEYIITTRIETDSIVKAKNKEEAIKIVKEIFLEQYNIELIEEEIIMLIDTEIKRKSEDKVWRMIDFLKKNTTWEIEEEEKEIILTTYTTIGGEESRIITLETTEPEELLKELRDIYIDFDKDEYVEEWVIAKRSGVQGVPNVRDLLQDAEEIEEALKELYEKASEFIEAD